MTPASQQRHLRMVADGVVVRHRARRGRGRGVRYTADGRYVSQRTMRRLDREYLVTWLWDDMPFTCHFVFLTAAGRQQLGEAP